MCFTLKDFTGGANGNGILEFNGYFNFIFLQEKRSPVKKYTMSVTRQYHSSVTLINFEVSEFKNDILLKDKNDKNTYENCSISYSKSEFQNV